MKLNKDVEGIVRQCMGLFEYERKQIISILIMTTLNDRPNKEAKEIYDAVIKQLSK